MPTTTRIKAGETSNNDENDEDDEDDALPMRLVCRRFLLARTKKTTWTKKTTSMKEDEVLPFVPSLLASCPCYCSAGCN